MFFDETEEVRRSVNQKNNNLFVIVGLDPTIQVGLESLARPGCSGQART